MAGGKERRKEGRKSGCVFRKAQAKVLTFGPSCREVAGAGTRRVPSLRDGREGAGGGGGAELRGGLVGEAETPGRSAKSLISSNRNR